MIDAWFSVLVISLIAALGGLTPLLIQSYRESLQHAENTHVLLWYRDHHRLARETSVLHKGRMSRVPTSALIEDASADCRELLEGAKRQCGMGPNPGERLRMRAPDDGAICRLGKIFKHNVFIDSVRAVQEGHKR